MSKIYTAQEMREMEKSIVRVDVMDGLTCREHCYPMEQVVRSMLRQAADAMECDEMRNKEYEYSLRTAAGHSVGVLTTSEKQARRHMISGDRLVRREVGEWEEVNDGE